MLSLTQQLNFICTEVKYVYEEFILLFHGALWSLNLKQ